MDDRIKEGVKYMIMQAREQNKTEVEAHDIAWDSIGHVAKMRFGPTRLYNTIQDFIDKVYDKKIDISDKAYDAAWDSINHMIKMNSKSARVSNDIKVCIDKVYAADIKIDKTTTVAIDDKDTIAAMDAVADILARHPFPAQKVIQNKCECGAAACSSPFHSDWCPLHNVV